MLYRTLLFILNCLVVSLSFAQTPHTRLSDTKRIANDLTVITKTKDARNYQNVETLNEVAEYIFNELSKSCDTVYYQKYTVNGTEYEKCDWANESQKRKA